MKISTYVDYICIFPVAQQLVGPTAALFHLSRLIKNVALRVFDFERWVSKQNWIDKKINYWDNEHIYWNKRKKEFYKERNIILLEYARPNFRSDISRIFTSLLQSLPGIGTLYSLCKYSNSQIYIPLIPEIRCG